MNPATLGIASDFVKSGIERAGIPLTQTLEAYLSITFARFIHSEIRVDMLTMRITRAMDARAPQGEMRGLADECLIATALFGRRLRRVGAIRHYIAMGQMTYDAAHMTEQAYGFVHMRDVIASAAAAREAEDPRTLVDEARAGSQSAQGELARQNVVLGPWSKPGRPGLLWR